MENVLIINDFMKYIYNVSCEELNEKFFIGGYNKKNTNLLINLRQKLDKFWSKIDENQKIKFINLMNERYDKDYDVEYTINLINKLINFQNYITSYELVQFYKKGDEEIHPNYVKDKLKTLKTKIDTFWFDLDEKNKEKFVLLFS